MPGSGAPSALAVALRDVDAGLAMSPITITSISAFDRSRRFIEFRMPFSNPMAPTDFLGSPSAPHSRVETTFDRIFQVAPASADATPAAALSRRLQRVCRTLRLLGECGS